MRTLRKDFLREIFRMGIQNRRKATKMVLHVELFVRLSQGTRREYREKAGT